MNQFLIILLSNILNIVVFWYFCNWCIKKIQCSMSMFLILTMLLGVRMFGANLEQPIINLFVAIVSYLFILKTRQLQWHIKIVLLVAFLSISVISEELSLFLLEIITGSHAGFTVFEILLATGMSKLILITFTYAVSRLFVTYTHEDIPKKDTVLFLLFPITMVIMILVSRYPIMIGRINIGYLLAFIFMLIAIIVCCYGFYRIAVNVRLSKENTLLKEKQTRDNDYYKLLIEKYENEHFITHDIKKNMRYLQALASEKDYDGIEKFLENYTGYIFNHGFILTGNKTFDIILSTWDKTIKKLNIIVELKEVRHVSLEKISELDQCTIFGNIIENAIDSCMKCEYDKRYIIFSFIEEESHKILKVINSCVETNKTDDGFNSTKKDKENHGFGLKNIEACVRKNNGSFHASYNTNQKEFTSLVIF